MRAATKKIIKKFLDKYSVASPRKIYINSYTRYLYESFEITKQEKTSVSAFGACKIITINLLVRLGFYNQDPCR